MLAAAMLAGGCGGSPAPPTIQTPPTTAQNPVESTAIPQELEVGQNEPFESPAAHATDLHPDIAAKPPVPRAFEPAEPLEIEPILPADLITRPEAPPQTPLPSPKETVAESPAEPTIQPSSVDPESPPSAPAVASTTEETAAATDNPAVATDEPTAKPSRQPLFEGWGNPQIALFISGRQHGYIEPCGCTGLANQKGGLARRLALKKQLESRGWSTVALDVGNQVRRFGRQAEIKLQMTVEGLKHMKYQAIGLGPDDLRLSVGELIALTADDGSLTSPFVSANAAIVDRSLTPAFHVIQSNGKKIGVTGILGDSLQKKINSAEIILKPAADGLREVWPKLSEQKCDIYVLLAQASLDETRKLAKEFPNFDVVVTAGGAGEPAFKPENIEGTKSIMVQVGTKGMYIGVVGWFPGDDEPLKYQRVPLDDRFADSPEMLQLLASYQKQLKTAGLEGLGVKPVPHTSGHKFVGSQACADCHEGEFDIWSKTTHAHALETLIRPGERSEIERHFDPECLSCHVTGWNPQEAFPYTSGYLSLQKSPLMFGSGCENCHGPGSAHVAAENGDTDNVTDELLEKLRGQMRLKLADAEKKCLDCHDLDNSPDFHQEGAFEKYWEKVAH